MTDKSFPRACAALLPSVFLLALVVGCSADDVPAIGTDTIAPTSTTTPTTVTTVADETGAGQDQTTALSTTTASTLAQPTLPDEEPEQAGFEIVELGIGAEVAAGDLVLLAWEMVAFDTGDVVESTADLGGPVPIPAGAGSVPSALDQAIIGQPVGTRLEVEFPAGMPDLPGYLDPAQAYVLAVEIVGLADEQDTQAAPATTTSTTPNPTTTAPSGRPGILVSANGPLAATPQADSPLPSRNSFETVTAGDGPALAEGDSTQIDYIVVSWTTGDIAFSTAEQLGGPQTVVLGDQTVPRILESAIFRQPVGSRIQVIYAPDLPDLPPGLAPDDAYIVAVDIIGKN